MGESSYLQETSIRRPELLFYRETIWKRDFFLGWIAKEIAFQLWPRHIGMALTLLTVSVVAYVLLLAIPSLLRHRYIVIAALFNLPGNALIGGGGGIGLISGMRRLFSYPEYLFAVCLAISPVPILFLFRRA